MLKLYAFARPVRYGVFTAGRESTFDPKTWKTHPCESSPARQYRDAKRRCLDIQMSRPTQTILHSGKFLALIKEGHWEYVDRVNGSGAALILAVTADRKILLVEQYRIPVHALTIELPAGIIGDEPGCSNESQAEAARRELLEETGYAADNLVPLMTGPSCSGLTSERVTLFRASELRRVGKGGGLANEEITIHEIPMVEVVRWLETKARTGVLIDPKIYAGLFFVTQIK